MSQPASPTPSESGRAAQSTQAHSVLIADDDDVLRNQLLGYLEDRGITCFTAEDGTQAIEMLERHHPDVALIDIHMPDISGLDVAVITADMQPRPKVIFMSAYAEAVIAANAAGLDAFAVIEKPLPLRDVARHVEQAFGG